MLQAGKMKEITDELINWDIYIYIYITALQEIRWNGSGWTDRKK